MLIGENGAGKSTLVEGIAAAYGLNPEGGTQNAMPETHHSESPLHEHMRLARGAGASRKGVFLRAETMHSYFAYLSSIEQQSGAGVRNPGRHNMQSPGESFLEFLSRRSAMTGLWVFDEPESALSFANCLVLIAHMNDLVREGSQVILSTHSPVLAALPGADLYELGDWGIRRAEYEELELVDNWRRFLDAPERYLRYLE